MSYTKRPLRPPPPLRSFEHAPISARRTSRAASARTTPPSNARHSQGFAPVPAEMRRDVQTESFFAQPQQQLDTQASWAEHLIAPSPMMTHIAPPGRRDQGGVALPSYWPPTQTAMPDQSPFRVMPDSLQAPQINAPMHWATQQNINPSHPDYWNEALFANGSAQPMPNLLPISHFVPTTFAPALTLQTKDEPAFFDASLIHDDWFDHLFAPGVLGTEALPTSYAHAPSTLPNLDKAAATKTED